MEKLYVLVRKDLSKSQQAVQGGHAVAEYLLRDRSSFWDNGTLVYLAVDDEEDLKSWGEIFHIMDSLTSKANISRETSSSRSEILVILLPFLHLRRYYMKGLHL